MPQDVPRLIHLNATRSGRELVVASSIISGLAAQAASTGEPATVHGFYVTIIAYVPGTIVGNIAIECHRYP